MLLKSTTILTGLALLATAASAQQDWRPTYNTYGTPGLIEMPTGLSDPSGQFTLSYGGFSSQQRGTISFQISDRLGGSFRYGVQKDFNGPDTRDNTDRSFDLRFRIVDEGRILPAVTVGLQDFLGTGIYSGEYVAATKHFGPNLRVTAGLGWGRLGTQNPIDNPLAQIDDYFETRPSNPFGTAGDFGEGGTVATDAFFRGDASFFGGVEYRFNDRLTGIVEYSGDAYVREDRLGTFEPSTPYNVGIVYKPRDEYQLSASVLQGETLALSAHFTIDPTNRLSFGRQDPAPIPVAVRPADARAAATWNRSPASESALRDLVVTALETEGVVVTAVEFTDRSVRIRYANTRYRTESQPMGRISRILTQSMPPAIENFILEPERAGIPLSRIVIRRSDVEMLENEVGATETSFARAAITDAAGTDAGLTRIEPKDGPLTYGIGPYISTRYFDPDQPIDFDFGVRATVSYRFSPNLVAEGAVQWRLTEAQDPTDSSTDAVYPVRTDGDRYNDEGNPYISRLTLAHFGRPAANIYSRVTVGYLERMFAGVSSELLWKPVDSRLALGAELNYVQQRAFDGGLGLRDYDVWTGHASAYYDLGNGYHTQIDVGRYLAGDWGATLSLDREFENGWRVGAFATRTDVSFEDFGEGSFDKGLRITIPTDWTIGTPTQQAFDLDLRSLQRDGGARLSVDGRLYEIVREGHAPELESTWGRYWR